MNRRIPATAVVGGSGMLMAAFLSTAVAWAGPGDDGSATGMLGAAADPDSASDGASNGFTAPDGLTLDPAGGDYDSVTPLFGQAPLLQLGGANVIPSDLELPTQDFDISNDGHDIGTVHTGVNASDVLGIDTAQFTVLANEPVDHDASTSDIYNALSVGAIQDSNFAGGDLTDVAKALQDNAATDVLGGDISGKQVTSALDDANISITGADPAKDIASALNMASTGGASGGDASNLPADGTTYSITELPFGLGENVYEATPNSNGDAASSIQDVLVTPLGNINLSTPFDAIANLDPKNAAAGVDAGSGGGTSPSDVGSGDGFTAPDNMTLDPAGGHYDSVTPLFDQAPLLQLGGGVVPNQGDFATQDFDVYDSDGDKAGDINAGVNTSDVLGIDSAQFTINGTESVDHDASALAIDTALKAGAIQDSSFTGGDLSDVTKALQDNDDTDVLGGNVSPGDVKEALDDANISITGPDTAKNIADDLNRASSAGADGEQGGGSDLPADGTTYSITKLPLGLGENVYEATPNSDGTEASKIHDVLVTPLGNINLSTPFDAVANLDPGNAAEGVDAGSGSTSTSDLGSGNGFTAPDGVTLDPSGGHYDNVTPLFGVAPLLEIGGGTVALQREFATQDFDVYNSDGHETGTVDTGVKTSDVLGLDSAQFTVTGSEPESADHDPSTSDIYTALHIGAIQDSSFKGGDLDDVVKALQDNDTTDVLGGNVSPGDVKDALGDANISISGGPNSAENIADDLNKASTAGASGDQDHASDLPADGTTYSITKLPFGLGENVYEATPNTDGDAAGHIQDVLVTPLGNINLSTPFDVIANLMPSKFAEGVDASGSVGSGDEPTSGAFTGGDDGGLGDLFGGGEDGGGSDVLGGLFG
jgi:hypothetical protein